MNTIFKFSAPLADRAKSPIAQAFVLCGALTLFGGCASEPESHRLSGPPPPEPTTTTTTVVTTQPQQVMVVPANVAPGTIYVTQAPPAPQQEVVVVRPSSTHAWVPGYWTWRNQRYEWVPGHWEVPARAGATWIPPRWEREDSAYRFYEGYWD